jgi:hypothetical protein
VEKDFHQRSGQGEDKTEAITSGFQLIGAIVARSYRMEFRTVFESVYAGLNGDRRIHTVFLKEICIHLGKRESTSSYNNTRDF